MRTRPRILLQLAALLLWSMMCLAPQQASAQQDVDTQVRALMREGEKATTGERFAEAEVAYEKAYALKPGFDVAANLADAERQLDKLAEAAEHYAFAIRNYPSSFDQKTKKSLQTALAEMQTKVATVDVTVSLDGATILVDGNTMGKSPLPDPLFLTPGDRTIEARLADRTASRQISADAGTRESVTLNLVRVPQNGTQNANGGGRGDDSVAGPAVLGVGIGVLALGVAGGIALTVVANDKAAEAEAAGPATLEWSDHQDLQEEQQTFTNAALWTFVGAGVGAALAGAGAYLWATADDEHPTAALRFGPWIGDGTSGAWISGRW